MDTSHETRHELQTEETAALLTGCILFQGLDPLQLARLLPWNRCRITPHPKRELLALQGNPCTHLGILLEGSLVMEKQDQSGHLFTLRTLAPLEVFGAALLFASDGRHQCNIQTLESTRVFQIPQEEVQKLCAREPQFARNYLRALSLQVAILQDKIELLGYRDVRHRLLLHLQKLFQEQGSLCLTLDHTKTEIAGMLGVARSSLSRELKSMAEEGLLHFHGRHVLLHREETLYIT
ncbi:Crp/Fnr family transcriptional regulator [Anaerotalea alkaliphila]|uniref:Crp/Fnr family transcriptional regulator n=1 Tax=Anaerotalea alkaliphila TaxID=2662126 RepID=A0A7X5HXA6_9FIRM|nr:Crp/Fnr family transcriptional regulator [Anaerotalea alkaliphila]NDL68335.1 Crp/Fnr family transcriptional regulator [Anaerotalea alkaliphila]